MIRFFSETPFKLNDKQKVKNWIKSSVVIEKKTVGDINFIFCNDEYLLEINKKHLNHDYFTDVISFNNSFKKTISGDIFISIDTVRDNAIKNSVAFIEELRRVMIHGVLHFIGHNDKTNEEKKEMRAKEDYYLSLFDNQ